MADILVESSSTLERVLTRNGVQPWRIPVLVKTQGVQVFRDKAPIKIAAPDERVKDGDWIRIVSPVPAATAKALIAEATASAKDYAFVPGQTTFDKQIANVLDARPQTIRLKDGAVTALTGFLKGLGREATTPIRHLIVASHANNEGQLFLSIGALDPAEISYEDLEAAEKSKTIVIDQQLLKPRPQDTTGADIPALFLVRGCRIGSLPPYLKKLRQALGNGLPVIAPKHFHVAAQYGNPPGYLEYMWTNWALSRPQALKTRDQIIAAFKAGGFTRIDGSPVPGKAWEALVPPNPHKEYKQKVPGKQLSPITKKREEWPGQFRYRTRQLWNGDQSFALKRDPGNDKDRKAAVRAELEKTHPQWNASHPFPAYTRLGFASMQEFIDGMHWDTLRHDAKSGTLFFNVSRAEYTVATPITDLATGEVFVNFYPTGKKGKVLELLPYADARFFGQA